MRIIDLSRAHNENYQPGRGFVVIMLWYLIEWLLIYNPAVISSRLKVAVLRLFGAQVGSRVIIRPRVRVKCPWRLEIGDHCWIGEGAWLHNQDSLTIGHDTVISQEAFITTGSHDTRRTMNLRTRPVRIGNGVWITSRAMVLSGTHVGDGVIVSPNSVVKGELVAWSIYTGNPGVWVRPRQTEDEVGLFNEG